MRILFYPPFKPLDHANPSGDLVTARGLADYFRSHGWDVKPASSLRSRWIYWKPQLWPRAVAEKRRVRRLIHREKPDLWLTYHTYYKAPDILGPDACRKAGLPYVIFQGIYSTKRRRDPKTLPGFLLNRKALLAAGHIFTNRKEDLVNLRRLIPEEKLTYVRPGIRTADFKSDPDAGGDLRRKWGVGEDPVVLSAAMFRPDVKTQGLLWVIRACGRLLRQGVSLHLAIAGDGREKQRILNAAQKHLGDRFILAGKIPREKMARFYSAGDVFAFPGFNETLGMVYLEAQSCGLPVLACDNGGIPEVVDGGRTGFLTPLNDMDAFTQSLRRLVSDSGLRMDMGRAAARYVQHEHDLEKNYSIVRDVLENCVDMEDED